MSGKDETTREAPSSPPGFKPMTHHREEEKYFYERDLELVRALRKRADENRQRLEEEQQKELHWMRCPKCGGVMKEAHFEALVLDQCESCKGVYLDAGELAILRKLALEGEQGTGEVLTRLIDALQR